MRPAFHTLGILTPAQHASRKFPASVKTDVRVQGGRGAGHFADSVQNGPGLVSRVSKDSVIPHCACVRFAFLCMLVLYYSFILSFFCEIIFKHDISVIQFQSLSSSLLKQNDELDTQL